MPTNIPFREVKIVEKVKDLPSYPAPINNLQYGHLVDLLKIIIEKLNRISEILEKK